MKYMIVDLEATDPYLTGITEIIEFGYAIVEDGKIIKVDTSFIKPVYSRLTPFIKQLTSITEENLVDAPIFEDFLADFGSKYILEDYIFVAWGNYDAGMVSRMCKLWDAPALPFQAFINLKKEHRNFYEFTKERGLAKALNHAHIELEGFHHRGVDDAYNTAKLFLDLTEKGWNPDSANLTFP